MVFTDKGVWAIDRDGKYNEPSERKAYKLLGTIEKGVGDAKQSIYPVAIPWTWHYIVTTPVKTTNTGYAHLGVYCDGNWSIICAIDTYTYVLCSDGGVYMCKINWGVKDAPDGSRVYKMEYCTDINGDITPVVKNISYFHGNTVHPFYMYPTISYNDPDEGGKDVIYLIPFPLEFVDFTTINPIRWAKEHITKLKFYKIIAFKNGGSNLNWTVKYHDKNEGVHSIDALFSGYNYHKDYCTNNNTGSGNTKYEYTFYEENSCPTEYTSTFISTQHGYRIVGQTLYCGLELFPSINYQTIQVERGKNVPDWVHNGSLTRNESDCYTMPNNFGVTYLPWAQAYYGSDYVYVTPSSTCYAFFLYPEDPAFMYPSGVSAYSDPLTESTYEYKWKTVNNQPVQEYPHSIRYADAYARKCFRSNNLTIKSVLSFSNSDGAVDPWGYKDSCAMLILTDKGLFLAQADAMKITYDEGKHKTIGLRGTALTLSAYKWNNVAMLPPFVITTIYENLLDIDRLISTSADGTQMVVEAFNAYYDTSLNSLQYNFMKWKSSLTQQISYDMVVGTEAPQTFTLTDQRKTPTVIVSVPMVGQTISDLYGRIAKLEEALLALKS